MKLNKNEITRRMVFVIHHDSPTHLASNSDILMHCSTFCNRTENCNPNSLSFHPALTFNRADFGSDCQVLLPCQCQTTMHHKLRCCQPLRECVDKMPEYQEHVSVFFNMGSWNRCYSVRHEIHNWLFCSGSPKVTVAHGL